MNETYRAHARARLADLLAHLTKVPLADGLEPLVDEVEALGRAVDAFHMEAIRFRMFNVDRLLRRLAGDPLRDTERMFAEVRASLEAAGFHTRSH